MSNMTGGLKGRLKFGVVAALLGVPLLGMSGCSFDEGYIKQGDIRLGEYTATYWPAPGFLAVLYRTTGGRSYNFPTTEAILGIYRQFRDQGYSEQRAAVMTLREMRKWCGGGTAGDRCRDATGDDEWDDFLYDTLVPVVWRPGECAAVFFRSGENWTTRDRTDRHCIPN